MTLRGLQQGRVDDKHRLKLPAVVLARLLEAYGKPDVFITSLDGLDVKIFPIAEWEIVERRLSEKDPESNPADGTLKKKFLFQANHYGSEGALDNQGRILIPVSLREDAGMRGEVRIQWSSNHLLVQSVERYEAAREQWSVSEQDKGYAHNLGL